MKFDLEERLVKFAIMVIKLSRELPPDLAGMHLAKQLIRSGTAPALNYGEAQSAESRKDFIHKMKIGLKELRETRINHRIIKALEFEGVGSDLAVVLNENEELIAIFHKSITTAMKNLEEGGGERQHSRLR